MPALDRIPPGVEVFRGVDPGYRHMCAVVYCFLDDTDELVVFDEIAVEGRHGEAGLSPDGSGGREVGLESG